MASIPTTAARPDKVVDATFVTRSLPDIAYTTGLVGLCTVPQDRSDPNDLGWHISDFLAFKTLLADKLHSRAQTWLTHCDIAAIVGANPDAYAHGKDLRVFKGERLTKLTSDVKIVPSNDQLVQEFLDTIRQKADIVKRFQYDLVVIVCGPTNLEQDIYFGTANYSPRIRSDNLRGAMGPDDESFRAVVITPAQFSAGWQVNPCFRKDGSFRPRADSLTFLAKQFGAIFARPIAEKVLSWECPMIDSSKVDPEKRLFERYPGPVPPPPEHRAVLEKVHKTLAARLMNGYDDHSFCFDPAVDDWEMLIGPRRGAKLGDYKKVWETLDATIRLGCGLPFLGNLFGGTKHSQMAHIEHQVLESLTMWQGVWTNAWGKSAGAKFRQFVNKGLCDESDCHEMFNVMEQRASLLVMADILAKYFELPALPNERCRDYTETSVQTGDVGKANDKLCVCIPWVSLDMDRGADRLSHVQSQHRRHAQYLAAVLGRAHRDPVQLNAALQRILKLLQEVQARQLTLLFQTPDFAEACKKWLIAIEMPMRALQIEGQAASSREDVKGNGPGSRNGQMGVILPKSGLAAPRASGTQGQMQASSPAQSRLGQSAMGGPIHGSTMTSARPSIREKCLAYLRGELESMSFEDLQNGFRECPDLTSRIIDRITLLGSRRGNAV